MNIKTPVAIIIEDLSVIPIWPRYSVIKNTVALELQNITQSEQNSCDYNNGISKRLSWDQTVNKLQKSNIFKRDRIWNKDQY